MAYSMVWLNGQLVGGWPYGYASYGLELTPYLVVGGRTCCPSGSTTPHPRARAGTRARSRWYPGAGIYRNVWLHRTSKVAAAHWGTFLTTPDVHRGRAQVDLAVSVDNGTERDVQVDVMSELFELDGEGHRGGAVATLAPVAATIPARGIARTHASGTLPQPKRWT
jgi:beta-galactosidase